MRDSTAILLKPGGKGVRNSCFGDHSLIMRKGRAIYGKQRRQRKAETAKEKREAKADLAARNALTEAAHRQAWELNTAMSRLGLKNKPGKKP